MALYTIRNYVSLVAYYGATGAMVTGAVLLGQPWVIGVAAVISGGVQVGAHAIAKGFFEKSLKEHAESSEDSPNLGKIVRELYAASGLKSDKFPVYDFEVDTQKTSQQSGKRRGVNDAIGAAFRKMSSMHNAAAYNMGTPVIMISKPLLKLLDDKEEKAVLAHEFAHAAARHHFTSLPLGYALAVTTMTAGITSLVTLFSSGLLAIGAAVGASLTVGIAAAVVAGKMLKSDDLLLDEKGRKTKANVKEGANLLARAASVGAVTLFNPAYLAVWSVAKAAAIVSKFILSGFSKSNEYQADRGAVQLGADPLALVTALRKITIAAKERNKSDPKPAPVKGYLSGAFAKATASHPKTDRRIARLAAMARKQNRTDAEIAAAVSGPIDMPDLSAEVRRQVESYALRI